MGNDKIDQLIKEAYELIDSYDYKGALRIGRKLKRLRHTSAFEIMALAYAENGKLKKAIKVLEKGVNIAPDLWILWQMLGNYRSDNGDFQGASEAYDKGLQTPNPDKDSLHLNIAVAHGRQELHDQAEQALLKIPQNAASDIRTRADAQLSVLFNKRGEHDHACQIALASLKANQEIEPQVASMLEAEVARANFSLDKKPQATEHILKAVQLNRSNTTAMVLLREIDTVNSSDVRLRRIMVEGRRSDPYSDNKTVGFFTSYIVAANSQDDAMEFIKRFESEENHDTLRVEENVELDSCAGEYAGIYSTSGYIYFDE